MDNFFEKIYIINLKRSPERKADMISQLEKNNVKNYIFIPTIDGKEIDKNKLKESNEWAYPGNKICNVDCSCKGKGHRLSESQLSLHLNNYYIWKDIVKNKYERCLILEDDCMSTEEYKDLNEDVKNMPDKWELLFLGHSNKTKWSKEERLNKFKKLTHGVNETHIYGVSLEGAKILINNTYPLRAAIDGYLAHFMINKGVLKEVYISSKNYGINGSIKKHYKTTI